MATVHVCQDDASGLWFAYAHLDDGTWELVSHAGGEHHVEHEARYYAERRNLPVSKEAAHRDYPEGGYAPGYELPPPREARV